MAIRVSVVICTTSFLLGILFAHWIADSLTLWKAPITTEHIWTSASYYSLFAHAPPEFGYFLATVVTVGASTILWSLGDGAAGNLMFDGASIFLYGTTVAVYLYKVIPTFDETFSSVPIPRLPSTPLPSPLRSEVLNVASANLVCSVALTGVMALQAARWWSEQADTDMDSEIGSSVGDDDSARRAKAALKRSRKRKNSKLRNSANATTSRLTSVAAAAGAAGTTHGDLQRIKE